MFSNITIGVNILCGVLIVGLNSATTRQQLSATPPGEVFCTHPVILDDQGKILPWSGSASKAYDGFLRLRWNFVKHNAPYCPGPAPRSAYPQYFFYCAFRDRNGVLEPDTWMNDVGEKIPNWYESARLYYAYTGDPEVMEIARGLVDYAIDHGTTPSSFRWPHFPYTAANAGDTEFRGFTSAGRLALHELHVDHAGEMGLTYYRMYLSTGETKYRSAAIKVADTLAENVRTGDATRSVWPYRVIATSGEVTAQYGANWLGCYALLDGLSKANLGDVDAYRKACSRAREFILRFPMKTGFWTDGHTDTNVKSNTYKSNLSASNATLYLLDHPEFDPDWRSNVPRLIKWTEDNFVWRCAPGEPATEWGANIVGEQDDFLVKMDYQTARYAAACARWYAVGGDPAYKEKAYRSLNWVTYCNDSAGKAFESPVSPPEKDISNWWSDCYGECPRMFYHAMSAVPEWAPPRENHILYSDGILRSVSYEKMEVRYAAPEKNGTEYLRLSFRPSIVSADGAKLKARRDLAAEGYTIRHLGNGDFAVTIRRSRAGEVVVR
jgi:hypothetical protein